MSVMSIDPQTDPRWHGLIQQCRSSAFHSPKWLRVLADTYGLEATAYLLVTEAGDAVAGLPCCRVEDWRGERLIALPFSDYCDPLVGDASQWNRLVEQVAAAHCPLILRCLHNTIPLEDERFRRFNRARWHGIDLRPELSTLWDQLDGSARRAIRKAQENGVVVRLAECQEDLRMFYELHLAVRKYKYQLLAQPYRFFENIWQQFMEGESGVLMLADYQGETIGGVLFLEWKDGLYYKFNASNPDRLGLRPNDLLIWTGIQYAKAKGYTHLDFGLSDWGQEGLLRYKRKYATEEKTISFLRWDNAPTTTPVSGSARQMGDLLPQLTNLFTDESVPDKVTERAGDLLYRFFA